MSLPDGCASFLGIIGLLSVALVAVTRLI